MEMVRNSMRINRPGRQVTNQFAIENDYNVPDSKPDVGRIIHGIGSVKLEETKRTENYMKISGKLNFQVLYMTTNEGGVPSSMEGQIPFEEMIYVEEDTEGLFQVYVSRTDFQVSMIHSRKLEVKAIAEVYLQEERIETEEIVSKLESDKAIFQKIREDAVLELYESKRDIFRIKEEIVLPGTKENMEKILWQEAALRKIDTKLSGGNLNLNGELQVFCIYQAQDGKIDWVERMLPFEGSISCVGVDESFYHHIYKNVGEIRMEIRLDEDGERRKIGIEAALELRILIYEEKNISFLEDAYSLEEKCDVEMKRIFFEEIVMQNHSKCKITEQLSLPEVRDEMLQICHSSGEVQIDKTELLEEGIQIEGILHVDFMYVKANDEVPFGTWSGVIPFSFLVECAGEEWNLKYDITYGLEQIAVELAGTGEIEIKAVLAFQSLIRKVANMQTIDRISWEPFDKKERGKMPGIVGYVVKKEDTLWQLAKKYRTTEERIIEMNSLTANCLKEGQKLLIFKENVSIL